MHNISFENNVNLFVKYYIEKNKFFTLDDLFNKFNRQYTYNVDINQFRNAIKNSNAKLKIIGKRNSLNEVYEFPEKKVKSKNKKML